MLVSLCTVCKNRSTHLKSTLLKNIADNIHDQDVEFVLLDYNSEDDLEEWVKENLHEYIESGLVVYYKTFEPKYFHRSHSRNMALKLAKGDIVCNVDADNFTGRSFTNYLRSCFSEQEKVFVCAGGQYDGLPYSDIGGRIGVRPSDLWRVGGYDENMSNYGSEDFDLIGRLELSGVDKILIRNFEYMKVIKHDIKNRIHEEYPFQNLMNIYIHYIDPANSKILYVFKDNTFALGTLNMGKDKISIQRRDEIAYGLNYNAIHINEDKWIMGVILINEDGSFSCTGEHSDMIFKGEIIKDSGLLLLNDSVGNQLFHPLKNTTLIELMLLLYSEKGNLAKMLQNIMDKVINPNDQPIGSGTVYKNFNYHQPIVL